jgi:hypothetical protein
MFADGKPYPIYVGFANKGHGIPGTYFIKIEVALSFPKA